MNVISLFFLAATLAGLLLLPSVQGRLRHEPTRRLLEPVPITKHHNFTVTARSAKSHSDLMELRDNAIRQAAAAINREDYNCSSPPRNKAYFDTMLGRIQDLQGLMDLQDAYGVLDWPFWYSWLIDMDSIDEVFGNNGTQRGKEYQRRFRQLKGFWDIKSDDILLKSLKGSIIADTEKMVHVLSYLNYDEDYMPIHTEEEIRAIVAEVQAFIETPGFGYDHPVLTFTAIGVSSKGAESDPWIGNVPDNILMGDGMLDYFKAVGLDASAPDMILAHEFAHHIQFELDLSYLYEGTPELTRKRELMADAFSAYFLAHKKGAAFNKNRIAGAFEAAFDLGDCAFSNNNHHGTPSQRGKAIRLGASIAMQNGIVILKASEFLTIFDVRYDELIAPDNVFA